MSDCNHCNGLSRSRFLHRAAAEAGRGLPAIEAGMPLPAGTGLSPFNPKLLARNEPFVLLSMYQYPLDGRKTAVSVDPSPS